MADAPIVEISGLQTSNNTFSASPPGSLLVAENCVMPQKGVIEPRRGQDRYSSPPSAAQIPFALTEFGATILANLRTSRTDTNSTFANCSTSPAVNYTGAFNPVDDWRMNFMQSGGYLYFCATTGAKCLETTVGQPRAAGLQDMPDLEAANVSPQLLAETWLPYGSSVAYRTVERRPTSGGVSLLSPPSGRYVVSNSLVAPPGAMVRTAGTTVTVTIPGLVTGGLGLAVGDGFDLAPGEANFAAGSYVVASVTGDVFTYADAGANVSNTVTQHFDCGPRAVAVIAFLGGSASTSSPIRLYRSLATSSATIEPSDEMFLVAETFPSGTDITNGFVRFADTTPDSVLSLTADPLYTNAQTGEGPTQINGEPPIYRDAANFAQRSWYANTTARHQFEMQMLGVGSPDGVQSGDTLTITVDGVDHVFPFGVGNVPITSDAVPSVNILRTTQSLIELINFTFSPLSGNVPVRAYYLGGAGLGLGRFRLKRTDYGDAFSVAVSRSGSWVPAFEDDVPQDSTAERVPNGLVYSKLAQPEAVPPTNFLNIGSRSYPIRRIIGLQNALLVFKAGDGIYSVTGSFPFQVLQISTANILAPDACALFADAAWVYTDQGILRVSDSGGATVVSRAIETSLNQQYIEFQSETQQYAFTVPYETERRIMFFVPFELSTAYPHRPVLRAWCYNNATQSWTGPVFANAFSGVVAPSVNKLAVGLYDYPWSTGRVTLERKEGDYRDIADANFGVTITAVSGNVLTLDSLTDVEVGDGILRPSGWRSKVLAIRDDVGPLAVEVYEAGGTTGAANIYKHYEVELQFQPAGAPTSRKTLTRLSWVFRPEQFSTYAGLSLMATDQIQADEKIETPGVGFGLTPFGSGPFGNPTPLVVDVNPLDPARTNAAQFFPGFRLSEAWVKFKLQGLSMDLTAASAPVARGK